MRYRARERDAWHIEGSNSVGAGTLKTYIFKDNVDNLLDVDDVDNVDIVDEVDNVDNVDNLDNVENLDSGH